MTPQEYNETRKRLSLTHVALAKLMGVQPQTSRAWGSTQGPTPMTVVMLQLIESIGVEEARRIVEKRK